MPRYEFSEGTSNKFWEIQMEGDSVTTRWGKIGTDGQSKTKSFPSEEKARKEYDKLVAEKTKKGYQLVDGEDDDGDDDDDEGGDDDDEEDSQRNMELEARILANIDDVDSYVVYGDWLQSKGHPRGELIALMHRMREEQHLPDSAAKFVKKHPEQLLGSLADAVFGDEDEPVLELTWKLGFIRSAKLRLNYDQYDGGEHDPQQVLSKLMAHPSACFLRELRLGLLNHEGDNDYDAEIDLLVEAGPRPSLQKLYIGEFEFPDETEMSWSSSGDCGKLWKLYPNLEDVTVQSGRIQLGKIDLPKVKSFTVKTGGLDKVSIQAIAGAKWPELSRLEVWFGSNGYGAEGGVDDIETILSGKGVGKVVHLGLMNAEFTDDICRALPSSKILKQLRTLDLSMGMMTDEGARVLADNEAKFAHLEKINLGENYLSDVGIDLVSGLCKGVDAGDQKDGESDYRYVTVGE